MAADWDSGEYDTHADTVKISETRTSAAAYDGYDADPDAENYASGNDSETACRDQGRPDSPNGLGSYLSEDPGEENEHAQDDYAQINDEHTETPETSRSGETPDTWGDSDPDAENYADLDHLGTVSPDGPDNAQGGDHAADHGDNTDATQQDQDQPAEENVEQTLPPEQQRISALEAANANARQQIADANQKIAELEAKNDEQSTRMDRIERLLADPEKKPMDPSAGEHGGDKTTAAVDHQKEQEAAITEHEGTRPAADTKDAHRLTWRRAASAENVGLASTALGAADTVTQFAMHATAEGVIGLGAMVLGGASVGLAKLEKKRKEQKKA